VSRGVAIADVDGDGDLDFAVANQWDRSYLYTNESRRDGASLELDLRLPATAAATAGRTRPAIGAAATVLLPDGRRLLAQVDGGSGHSGKRAPMVHFGLGRLAPGTLLPVELRWRDGQGRVRSAVLRFRPGAGIHRVLLGSAPPRTSNETGKGKAG
jgi:hypothetical protein